MERRQVEERAYELFQGGLICSESVLLAVLEGAGAAGGEVGPRVATAFGGGVGRSREELCGALAGGLIALGLLEGRDRAGENWDDVAVAAAAFREEVRALTGHTRCRDILEALGPQENMEKCKRLTANAAGILHELLRQAAPAGARAACGCRAARG